MTGGNGNTQKTGIIIKIVASIAIFGAGVAVGAAITGGKAQTPGAFPPVTQSAGQQLPPQVNQVQIPETVVNQAPRPLADLLQPAKSMETILVLNLAEAKQLYDSGKTVFVDARDAAEFEYGHVKGAVSITMKDADSGIALNRGVLKNKIAVIYCYGTNCKLSHQVAHKLYTSGITNVVIFSGGWPEWEQSAYPLERNKTR